MTRDDYLTDLAERVAAGQSQRTLAAHYGKSRSTIRRDLALVSGRAVPVNGHRPDDDGLVRSTAFVRQIELVDPGSLKGGRITRDVPGPGGQQTRIGQVVPYPDEWRLEDVTPDNLRRLKPAELLARLTRVSPEIGRAHYDFLRLANPGWSCTALDPVSKQPHEAGQVALDLFFEQLRIRHGSVNVIWNKLFSGMWLRGALLVELVLDGSGNIPVDLATPDPYTAQFRVVKDPLLGERYELVQKQERDYVNIERPTVKYVPADPLPGSPYGTAPCSPGLFPAMFIVSMLMDARRVVAQQGWPRLDIIVEVAKVVASMPPGDQRRPDKVRQWVEAAVSEVVQGYGQLDPDKAWVHTDAVVFGTPIGAIGDLDGVAPLVDVLERMNTRALKTMPMMMGLPEGVSEANANRQWEMLTRGVESMQDLAEDPLSDLCTLAMQCQGIAAVAKFTFDQMRSSEEKRDAETMTMKLANAAEAQRLGFFTFEEAAIYAIGRKPAPGLEPPEEQTEPTAPGAAPERPDESPDEEPKDEPDEDVEVPK